uniref:Uncharacterized protein n=1 Tax=Arundo donax TaxID=35708 RepID=A0A0A9EQ99_ARUDO
MSRFFSSVSNS